MAECPASRASQRVFALVASMEERAAANSRGGACALLLHGLGAALMSEAHALSYSLQPPACAVGASWLGAPQLVPSLCPEPLLWAVQLASLYNTYSCLFHDSIGHVASALSQLWNQDFPNKVTTVLPGASHAWLCLPGYAWTCLVMPDYACLAFSVRHGGWLVQCVALLAGQGPPLATVQAERCGVRRAEEAICQDWCRGVQPDWGTHAGALGLRVHTCARAGGCVLALVYSPGTGCVHDWLRDGGGLR